MDIESVLIVVERIGSIGAPAIAVVLGMKYAINGMREDVSEIKNDVKDIKVKQSEHTTQIAVLQARNVFQDSIDNNKVLY